ncbi:MAG TPA: EAL domain-containing protein [Scandinavium sp.]|jgi:sensor c-di-GMP phosphodiesterase-like protein
MIVRNFKAVLISFLCITTLLPVGLNLWLSAYQEKKNIMESAEDKTARIIVHTNLIIKQASLVLNEANKYKEEGCSPEHLSLLRNLVYRHRYIQEVIYLKNSIPQCSSFSEKVNSIALPTSFTKLATGESTWLTSFSDLGFKKEMVAIGSKNNIVMIDPKSFIDALPLIGSSIGVAVIAESSNKVITSTKPISPERVQEITLNKQEYINSKSAIYIIKKHPNININIVIWSSYLPIEKRLTKQLLLWIPSGAILSIVISFLLFRLLQKQLSPKIQLINAIRNNEISVNYQPITSLKNRETIGAEALARWQLRDGSFISPEVFIPLAEESGMMPELTELIIKNIFIDLGEWLNQNPRLYISINLSVEDLMSSTLKPTIHKYLKHYQTQACQFVLELTERQSAPPHICGPILKSYRADGFKIYLDDFGTGYSNISYLQSFEVDAIKIDRFFVQTALDSGVTDQIIKMAKLRELSIIAEGIENEEQHNWLYLHGVEYGQGWLYSKALSASEFMALTKR